MHKSQIRCITCTFHITETLGWVWRAVHWVTHEKCQGHKHIMKLWCQCAFFNLRWHLNARQSKSCCFFSSEVIQLLFCTLFWDILPLLQKPAVSAISDTYTPHQSGGQHPHGHRAVGGSETQRPTNQLKVTQEAWSRAMNRKEMHWLSWQRSGCERVLKSTAYTRVPV